MNSRENWNIHFFYLFDLALAQDGKIIGTMHSYFRLKCTENFLEL